jgi:hypothetical protein
MFRSAEAEHATALEAWNEAREEMQRCAIALERATYGLPASSVEPDAEGRAVRAVTKIQHVQVQRQGQNMVDRVFSDHVERLPQFDAVTLPLHEARQAHAAARDRFQEAGRRGGELRKVVEEAAEALGRTGLPRSMVSVPAGEKVELPAWPR